MLGVLQATTNKARSLGLLRGAQAARDRCLHHRLVTEVGLNSKEQYGKVRVQLPLSGPHMGP